LVDLTVTRSREEPIGIARIDHQHRHVASVWAGHLPESIDPTSDRGDPRSGSIPEGGISLGQPLTKQGEWRDQHGHCYHQRSASSKKEVHRSSLQGIQESSPIVKHCVMIENAECPGSSCPLAEREEVGSERYQW
jgi:hypothetical protein